jgi:threonine/homoserine/homoserine lactone efflux protein
MPVAPGLLGAFVLAALLLCVTPGPDMIYIVTHGVSQGTRQAVVAGLGMAAGMLVHTSAVTLGLAGLVRASPVAYDVVRYGGAAYLVVLGWRTIREARATPELAPVSPAPLPAVFTRATLTNLLNPKIVLFYLAFLPQFTEPGRAPLALQFLVLGLVFVVLGLVVDTGVALLSGRVGDWLTHNAKASQRLNEAAGLVFFGLAGRLVLT